MIQHCQAGLARLIQRCPAEVRWFRLDRETGAIGSELTPKGDATDSEMARNGGAAESGVSSEGGAADSECSSEGCANALELSREGYRCS